MILRVWHAEGRGIVISTADLASEAFRRATNRQKPPLPHPTANAFDEQPWRALIEAEEPDLRDYELATAAVYFGRQIRSLRREMIGASFEGLGKREVLRLSVARANRAFMLIRRRSRAPTKRSPNEPNAVNLQGFAHRGLGGNRLQPDASADAVISGMVDAVPHWFAQAAVRGERQAKAKLDFGLLGARAEGAFSIERSYRDLWQQVLWEPWSLGKYGASYTLVPKHREEALKWYGWALRQEAITTMPGVLDRFIDYQEPGEEIAQPLQTVVDATVRGRALRIRTAKPSKVSAGRRTHALAVAKASYLGGFLDQPLDDDFPEITSHLLSLAWMVLDDLAECLIKGGYREGLTYPEVRSLSFGVPRATLLSTFRTCLGVSPALAEAVARWLTSDPTDLSACFRMGVWHRPLIKLDEEELLLLAAPICVGNGVRRIERWLQYSKLAERLSSSPPGILYERNVRLECAEALEANDLIMDGEVSREGLKAAKKDGEEIDFLARIGSVVLVGEIKCLLIPTESAECYDHRRKLEEAAAQAERKASWLATHRDVLAELLKSAKTDAALTFLPIVILNQSAGSGEVIGDCIITDAHFLKLYLGSSSFSSGAVLNVRTGAFEPLFTSLYASAAEAEAKLVATLSHPPGLKIYLDAVRWKKTPIPTREGVDFLIDMPYLDGDAMHSPDASAIAKALLAES